MPGGTTIERSKDNISVFNRPIEISTPAPPTTEHEEEEDSEAEDVIQYSRDAPTAPILGPFCVICGRFGQYICDLTEEDVCSIECKKKAETIYKREHAEESEEEEPKLEDVIEVDPSREHQYIANKRRFKDAVTILDSHKCPLCGKTGHLPQDCHLASGKWIHVDRFARGTTHDHYIRGDELSAREKEEVTMRFRSDM